MGQPTDFYSQLAMVPQANPAASFQQGQQVGMGLLETHAYGQEQQQKQAARQQVLEQARAKAIADAQAGVQLQEDRDELLADVNEESMQRFFVKHPEMAAPLKEVHARLGPREQEERLRQASQIDAAISAGAIDVAAKTADDYAAAYEKTRPKDAQAMRALAERIRSDPTGRAGALAVGSYLVVNGGEKYGKAKAEFLSSPAVVAEQEAKAKTEQAKASLALDREIAEIGLIDEQAERLRVQSKMDGRRLNLDERELALRSAKQVADLQARAVDLSEKQQGVLVDASTAATAEAMVAERAGALAAKFDVVASSPSRVITAGAHGEFVEEATNALGVEGPLSEENALFERVIAAEIAARHKAEGGGPMSNADFEIARRAYPARSSAPEMKAKFLREVEARAALNSKVEGAKAEWLAENGSLGPARKPIVVGGFKVQPGQTYQQVVESLAADAKAKAPGAKSDEKKAKAKAEADELGFTVVD